MSLPLLQTDLSGFSVTRGKVRDVYDLGDNLLLVSTDRISAFDWVLPTGIPDKGRVLTQLSNFWFNHLKIPNHLLETDVEAMDLPVGTDLESLAGRTILVRKTEVVPIECVVRGFLSGSAWQEYCDTGKVCGIELPTGLQESSRFPSMIFSPATKAEQGDHDENITFSQMCERVGHELADKLRHMSIETYQQGAAHAHEQGIIVADTKFEFGVVDGEVILIDEVLTPDSSRFWPADLYEPGHAQPSFDKQYVRDWLTNCGWDKNSTPPELPEEVVARTREKYIEAYNLITGETFAWK
ncbi:phosphoribosylaminoimidazolesuccinocarboxamide synthase [Bythopirellula polymerisocia]|uniref:Phosphoribosylaminoimidazole-succinocarboxamide synthase n=1 Tax=Bythopirellula polymerisocia TaxID=2528003 RepID=A0A5C6CIV4_9BACT|nr:phosphoribosylaminoimidazolesuccinocarboxamide synthase [Bythopirellula polymerisocia]TWU24713.1 Phosphoribosylaminoimidazole-succinocarboxamide synthase [Bythopirellula polymerisocia]